MRLVIPLATVALAACSEFTLPERPDPYQFSINCAAEPRCSRDAPQLLIFNWPIESLPVRIWVQPGSGLGSFVADAIRLWMGAGLYGEFRAGFVTDSLAADVMIELGEPREVVRIGGLPQLDCIGSTAIEVALDTTIVLPFRTLLSPRLGATQGEVAECLRVVAPHELGHALGLLIESDDPDDLMFAQPTVRVLSRRDRATFGALYHSNPTIRTPAGR